MALPTLHSDSILTLEQGKAELESTDTGDLIRVLNMVTAKAKATMSRVQLNQNLDTAIVERIRKEASETIFLHAPVYTTDYDTHELKVDIYCAGTLDTTYLASDGDIIVTSDDYSARIDLPGACFPAGHGADYIEVTYYGGWESIPGDVYGGAVTQARIDMKRMKGTAGMASKSMQGQSVQFDQRGVIQEVSEIWQMYRMLI
jgi:hypothetical protein